MSAATIFDLWYTTQKQGPSRIQPSDFQAVLAVIEDPDANVDVLPIGESAGAHAGFVPRDELPDPFDRMIVATALEQGLPLVTADKRITSLDAVPIIW